MAKIKIESIVEHLDYDLKRALEDAVNRAIPDAQFDRSALFREFTKAVGRKCNTWIEIPDRYVE